MIESTDHFAFNAGPGARVFTDAHVDYGSTYSADGVFLFRGTYHAVEHRTFVDGVLQVDFYRFHFRAIGIDC